jgi:site-specific recombinase XerD
MPAQLDWDNLDAITISAFLNHLESERHNSTRTRNVRLTAIRSLFSYAALRHPEHALLIQRVLAIPPKRFDKRIVTFLTATEVDPLFPTRTGRRLSRDAVALRVSTHAATAAQRCPSLLGKKIHPHVLRHSCARLQAGVDTSVIALWLGHASVRSTDAYIHADISIKERALALTTPPGARPGRYRPTDKMLAFLEGL